MASDWWIYKKGTTTADGALDGSTVVDTNRTEDDDFFNNMLLKITSGAALGESQYVSDWVKSTGTFTMASPFSTQILSGVTYEVGVQLPRNPRTVAVKNAAKRKDLPKPGDLAIVMSLGKQVKVLTLEGILHEAGQTSSYLETYYIKPLENLVHYTVFISAPDTRYDGECLLNAFPYKEEGGAKNSFKFNLEIVKGSSYVVL